MGRDVEAILPGLWDPQHSGVQAPLDLCPGEMRDITSAFQLLGLG